MLRALGELVRDVDTAMKLAERAWTSDDRFVHDGVNALLASSPTSRRPRCRCPRACASPGRWRTTTGSVPQLASSRWSRGRPGTSTRPGRRSIRWSGWPTAPSRRRSCRGSRAIGCLPWPGSPAEGIGRFRLERTPAALVGLAEALWLTGEVEEAVTVRERPLAAVRQAGMPKVIADALEQSTFLVDSEDLHHEGWRSAPNTGWAVLRAQPGRAFRRALEQARECAKRDVRLPRGCARRAAARRAAGRA